MERACNIAVIGGGPAGCSFSAFADKKNNITIFDTKPLLSSILPTGGGKCNITNAEPDFREFARNYPRGEKFLYSVFSRFSSSDAVDYFDKIGIKTVVLDNGRVFPEKMDSKFVRQKLLEQIKHCRYEKQKITSLSPVNGGFKLITSNAEYFFDKVIVAAGGHCNWEMLKNAGISLIPPKPALTGLCTEKSYSSLSGVSLKNVYNYDTNFNGDLLFTHFGISGPLIFKISSIRARDEFPYTLIFDLIGKKIQDGRSFQKILDKNPKKELKNILAMYLPRTFAVEFSKKYSLELSACEIKSDLRDTIIYDLKNYKITVTKPRPDGETVTAGGVDLKFVNPKTMEYKTIPGLYFIGEVLNIDGFCGGFNLQNCWSNAYIAAAHINNL